jgi:hypothetical protein
MIHVPAGPTPTDPLGDLDALVEGTAVAAPTQRPAERAPAGPEAPMMAIPVAAHYARDPMAAGVIAPGTFATYLRAVARTPLMLRSIHSIGPFLVM